jgi:hypothetical protein
MLSAILSHPSSRARVDFASTFAELDGLLYTRGLRAAKIDSSLAVARGRLGVAIAVKAFEGERVARAVVTHVSATPFFAGLSIVAHPRRELAAPVLVADVRVIPSGVTRAFLDACGDTGSDFDALFRKPLSQTLDAAVASAVRRQRVPEWLDRVSQGAGAQLAAAPGRGHVISYALVRYVERWLDGVERAKTDDDGSAARAATRACDTIRANGRATKMVARAFGGDFATRWASLVWSV